MYKMECICDDKKWNILHMVEYLAPLKMNCILSITCVHRYFCAINSVLIGIFNALT